MELNRDLTTAIPNPVPGQDNVFVTYTLEVQEHGLLRHASMSVGVDLPHPVLVEQLIPFLGFVGGLKQCKVWVETLPVGEAINVLQPEDGDWTPFLVPPV